MSPQKPTPPPGSLRSVVDEKTPAHGTHPLRRLPSDNGAKHRRALYEAAVDSETTEEGRFQAFRLWMGDLTEAQDAMSRSQESHAAANRTAHAKAADRDAALLQRFERLEKGLEDRDTILIKELGKRAATDDRHDRALTAREVLTYGVSSGVGLGLVMALQWLWRHLP